MKEDTLYKTFEYNNYMIAGNGHPKSYYNKLLCEEIKKYIFNYNIYSLIRMKKEEHKIPGKNTIEYYESKIRKDQNWLRSVQEKAIKRNIPLDSMIKLDAEWMVQQNNQ